MNNMRQKDLRPAPALIEFKGMKFLITDRPSDVTIQHYITELKKNNVNTVVRVCEPSYNTDELEAQGIVVKDLAFEDGTFPPQHVVDEWFEILKQNFTNVSNRSASYMKSKRFSLRNKSLRKSSSANNTTNITKTTNTNTNTQTNANDNTDSNAITSNNVAMSTTIYNSTINNTITTSNMTNTPNTSNTAIFATNNITTKYLNNTNNKVTTRTTTETSADDNKTTCRYQQTPEACVAVHCVAGLGRAPVLVALALIELGLKYEAAVEMIRDKRRGAINAKQLSFLERYKPKARLKHKNGHKNSCCVQ